jgi:competence protein ComEA
MRRLSLVGIVMLALLVLGGRQASAQDAPSAPPGTSRSTPAPVVNLNTATPEQFEALPGIGAKMAARIVEYRQKNGSFKKVEELMNVKGIGEQAFLKLKPYLTLGGPKADRAPGGQR